jgi:glc operon protein GlcG
VLVAPTAQVRESFARGAVLLDNHAYQVHTSRRDAPGKVEIHQLDTDIFYVLEGSATLVTGGKVPDAASIGPNELRGSRIDGGETRTIARGDVVVVPHGTPHWFREVQGPVLYFAVKVQNDGVAP